MIILLALIAEDGQGCVVEILVNDTIYSSTVYSIEMFVCFGKCCSCILNYTNTQDSMLHCHDFILS